MGQSAYGAYAADESGRHRQDNMVNQPLREETRDDARPSLHHHTRDAQGAQPFQQSGQVDMPSGIHGQTQDAGAGRLEHLLAAGISLLTRSNPGRQGMLTQQVRAQWEAQPAVGHDGLRVLAFCQAHGETGIVGQYGPDTHQDSVVRRPQLVRQGHGQRTAQRQWLTRTGRDGTIHTLCVT